MSRGNREDDFLTDVEFRAWHGCLQFTSAVMRALDEALLAAHRISVKEFDVLITLFNAPGYRLRMTELAERVVLTPSGVTHLATRLEHDGLIGRSVDETDRRGFFATLTRAGQRRLRESRRTHNEVVRAHLTQRLSASQLEELGAIWEALLSGAGSRTANTAGDSVASAARTRRTRAR
jgi:DNA-binding MarR family transcriptional regulator